LSSRLNTIHNLFYYINLLRKIREAIRGGGLLGFFQAHTSHDGLETGNSSHFQTTGSWGKI